MKKNSIPFVFLSLSLCLTHFPHPLFADDNQIHLNSQKNAISIIANELQNLYDSTSVITNSKENAMRPASMITNGLSIVILCGSTLGFAGNLEKALSPATELIITKDKLFDPHHLSFDSMQMYEKNFNFDWNNIVVTMEPNKNKISDIEHFIKITKPEEYTTLNNADRHILGKIIYKLGTYYTHVTREPQRAIERMNLADIFLHDRREKIWIYNHLAYAYEQKYVSTKKEEDQQKALEYINKVFDLTHNAKCKEVAFAFCMQGLLHNNAKNFGLAEISFKNAINIYEKIPGGKDEQYVRAKNRLASIILDMNGRDQEAMKMLKEIKQYWLSKGNEARNPYAARNHISLGQAYLKLRSDKNAENEFKNALHIYQNVYGNNTELLKPTYQLLAETYKNLGNKKLADTYLQKANGIKKNEMGDRSLRHQLR